MSRPTAEGTELCAEWGITRKQARSLGGIEYLESLPDLSRRVLINSFGWHVGLPKCPSRLKRLPKVKVACQHIRKPRKTATLTPRAVAKVERMMYLAERLAA